MQTIMSLLEIISKLETLSEESTIYATKPWTEQSKALVLNEPESGGLLEEAENEGMKYFLEISIARELLEDWKGALALEPTTKEKCKRLIQYTTYDV